MATEIISPVTPSTGYYSRAREYLVDQVQPLDTMPSTVGVQIFGIVPGIAGGIAGFLLAYRLSQARRVRTAPLILASLLVAAATLAAIFLVRAEPEATE